MRGWAEVPTPQSIRAPALPVLNFWADLSDPAMQPHDTTSDSRKRAIAGVGRVLVWPGGSIWIGRHVGHVPTHAHHAIQISLALDGRFRIRAPGWAQSQPTAGVVIQPDRPHSLDGCDGSVATLFVEPNSTMGAALRRRYGASDVTLLDAGQCERTVADIRARFDAAAANEILVQSARDAIAQIAGDPAIGAPSDARITAALDWMRQRLTTPLRLEDVAEAVHLSPSRFRHLFVAQTGTSFRAWVLWARAEAAIESGTHGGSWTQAAQDAGFADAAHFTRTCRRVFGIAPTMLVFD